MNTHLLKNLIAARADLLDKQQWLHRARTVGFDPRGLMVREHTRNLYRALDRVWEAQCMAQGSIR